MKKTIEYYTTRGYHLYLKLFEQNSSTDTMTTF